VKNVDAVTKHYLLAIIVKQFGFSLPAKIVSTPKSIGRAVTAQGSNDGAIIFLA